MIEALLQEVVVAKVGLATGSHRSLVPARSTSLVLGGWGHQGGMSGGPQPRSQCPPQNLIRELPQVLILKASGFLKELMRLVRNHNLSRQTGEHSAILRHTALQAACQDLQQYR